MGTPAGTQGHQWALHYCQRSAEGRGAAAQEAEPLRSLIRGELEKVNSLTLAEDEPGGGC